MNMDILYKIVVAIGIFGSLGVTIWTHFSSKNRNKEDEKVKQEKKQEAFNSAQEAFNSVSKEKLEKIEGQVNNHLPTQIKEVKKELKEDINKLETKIDNNQKELKEDINKLETKIDNNQKEVKEDIKEVNNKLDQVLNQYSNNKTTT